MASTGDLGQLLLGSVEPGLSGHLVGRGDWHCLARYSSELLADPQAMADMSAEARRFARRFSSSKMAEQMIDIYLQALSQQGRRAAGPDYGGLSYPDSSYAKANGRSIRKYGLRGF